jgi:hypothetical protein
VGAHSVTTMYWFRSRAKEFSYVALFALSLQLVLSFGHLRINAGANGAGHAAKILAVDDATASISAVDPASQGLPGDNDDYCAICAVIHLARTLVLAPAPSLLLPATYAQAQFAPENDAAAAELLGRTPFQARAPPTV